MERKQVFRSSRATKVIETDSLEEPKGIVTDCYALGLFGERT